jgi:GNAT superfamily N-acetyltransferase
MMSIRRAQSDDFVEIVELLQELSAYRPDVPVEWFVDNQNKGYVAVDDDEIIGFMSWHLIKKVRGGNVAVIEDVVIRADRQGLGVGGKLLQHVLEEVRAQKNIYKVVLESSKVGESLYRSQGFSFSRNKALYLVISPNEDISNG